jgi:predicted amidohydrolase
LKSKLTIAAVQVTATEDVAVNLDSAARLARAAADAGADLIALPENFGFIGSEAAKVAHAQSIEDGPFVTPLRELARGSQVAILAGSIPETAPDAGRTYNTSVLIGRDGETLASYRKIHLFDVELGAGGSFCESGHVSPGDEPVLVNFEGWTIGLTVCYDLRFPELYRALSAGGARLLAVPAAFTLHTGKDHWEALIRARAIENLCYVVAPGQFGHHSSERASWGKSMIVDPWGTLLAVAPERETFVLAEIDAVAQDQIRREIPSLDHRRM